MEGKSYLKERIENARCTLSSFSAEYLGIRDWDCSYLYHFVVNNGRNGDVDHGG